MLHPDNEGVGLNMYDEYVTDPYATNAINTEIVSNLGKIKSRVLELKEKNSEELVFEDIEVLIERILNRNPIPNELMIRNSSEVYLTLKKEKKSKNDEEGEKKKEEEKPAVE